MKDILLSCSLLLMSVTIFAQNNYPDPEFSNEVYLYRKDSASTLMRLEKQGAKLDSKTKMAGFGGAESVYNLEGDASPIRVNGGGLCFVFSKDAAKEQRTTEYMDSLMKANGYDPSKMGGVPGMGSADPSNAITLYKVSVEKGSRKIYYMKTPGAFGGKKGASDKYSFSIRKIREGYWELVVDKSLPKGEYAFTLIGAGLGNMDGSVSIFAFGVD